MPIHDRSLPILLIDDEPEYLGVLAGMLQRHGYQTAHARSGKQALEILEQRSSGQGEASFLGVISDWVMAEVDGLEVLRRLRAGPNRDLPFVLVSGAMSLDRLEAAMGRGADGILCKPFSSDELVLKIEEAVALRRAEHSRNPRN